MEDLLIEAGLDVLENIDDYIDMVFENGLQFQQPIDVNIIPDDPVLAWIVLGII